MVNGSEFINHVIDWWGRPFINLLLPIIRVIFTLRRIIMVHGYAIYTIFVNLSSKIVHENEKSNNITRNGEFLKFLSSAVG